MAVGQGELSKLRRRAADEPLPLPNLIEIQTASYEWFLEDGLKELFEHFSDIQDYTGNITLDFLEHWFGVPKKTIDECRESDSTYERPMYARVRLVNKETGEIKESEIYMGELPVMTEWGTFVINGAERVVISQLSRSAGAYFKDAIDSAGRVLYAAQIIPSEGAWVEINQAANGSIGVKLGQTRRFPVTTLLRALDWFVDAPGEIAARAPSWFEHERAETPRTGTNEEILRCFGQETEVDIKELLRSYTRREEQGMPGVETHQVYYALERIESEDGQVLTTPYTFIPEKEARGLQQMGRKAVRAIAVPFQLHATLDDDPARTSHDGLLDVYRKIRPGDPPTADSAASLLYAYFFDVKRYDLSRVGRHKMNKKLGLQVGADVKALTRADVIAIIQYLLALSNGEGSVDDIDHLQNKRVRAVGELLQNQLRTGFFRMERVARERMTSLDPDEMVPQSVISIKPIAAAINSFFGSGQLSQFMDQINPLAELAHKRRLSALGPGGLSKQSAKLEVRDVHHSHYGRICPIETPEGPNVGLIGYLTLHAKLDDFGFLQTPYRIVRDGRVTDEIVYLTADEEEGKNIASVSEEIGEDGTFVNQHVPVRNSGGFYHVTPEELDLCDISARQIFSVATSMIPFMENDEAVRALAGSNMQRQAVPLLTTEPGLVTTGMERPAARDSGAIVLAPQAGEVLEADSRRVVVRYADESEETFRLHKFVRTNMATCVNQRPIVRAGQRFEAGDTLVDGAATNDGELALGKNLLVAFLPWEGYNYEDAIVISERLVRDDVLTSIHMEKYECEARDTKLGPEEITRDIPNVGDEALRDLDDQGVVRVGAVVTAEDILVGKVAPKGQSELTAEEKLVIAIFGKKAEEMRDVSLRVPHGEKGVVISTKVFSRFKYECANCGAEYGVGKPLEYSECDRCGGRLKKLAGDELKPGVNQMVRVFVAQRRKIMVGDKLTGRHGNKGVISRIVAMEDMPHLSDGTPIDVCLNPLGVPSRMNIGQIMETHLGMVAKHMQERFVAPIFEGYKSDEIKIGLRAVREVLEYGALREYATVDLAHLGISVELDDEGFDTVDELAEALSGELGKVDPEQLAQAADWLGIPEDELAGSDDGGARLIVERARANAAARVEFDAPTGRAWCYDGRTGERFNQPISVGYMYVLKLHHLAEDKMHARSTGPYSLITQQPLGGKAQMGGQRFGEMEVWALEAYGAAHCLQEMLTVKSDDVQGRVQTYEAIVKDENIKEPGIPESFKILVREMQSLALNVQVEGPDGEPLDLKADSDGFR